jgi:hypothetical protein
LVGARAASGSAPGDWNRKPRACYRS